MHFYTPQKREPGDRNARDPSAETIVRGKGSDAPFPRPPGGRSETILVVDDDESVRELMAVVLETDGFTVLRAGHSEEALRRSGEYSGAIHLLLTDFSMKPHQNGLELARQVRAARPDIKVVVASGFVEQDALRDEIGSAPSYFLPKPFSPSGLLACVRKALGIRAQAP